MSEGFTLSGQQRRLWRLQENEREFFLNTLVVEMKDADLQILEEAINTVIAHHEILKVKFLRQGALKFPEQHIAEKTLVRFQKLTTEKDSDHESIKRQINAQVRSEDTTAWFTLLQYPDGSSSLYITQPAICGDIESIMILLQDACRCYVALKEGTDTSVLFADDALQYIDYSEWQQELAYDNTFIEDQNYWKKNITRNEFEQTIPFEKYSDHPGTLQSISISVDEPIADQIDQFATKQSIRPSTVVLWCWHQLLSSFNKNILLGCSGNMRHREELQSVVGPFKKYYPLKFSLVDKVTFKEIQNYQANNISRLESFDMSLFSDEPVCFQYLFDAIHLPSSIDLLRSLEYHDITSHSEKFSLKLTLLTIGNKINKVTIHYDDSRYEKETIQNILTCLTSRLNEIVHSSVNNDRLLGQAEINLIDQITQGKSVTSETGTVVARFHQQAVMHPDNKAVTFGSISLTYQAVNKRSDEWAQVMKKKWNIQEGAVVAVHVKRSENLMCALLSILKTGACYLPIDIHLPEMRKAMIVEDAKPDLILTDSNITYYDVNKIVTFEDLQRTSPDNSVEFKRSEINPDTRAYIIYTSGTTGKPKGVCVSHKALNNYVRWFENEFRINASDQTLLLSSIAYDLCYSSLWTAITAGGALNILNEYHQLDVNECIQVIDQQPVTYLKMTPSHLKLLLSEPEFVNILSKSSLRILLLGGEPIDVKDLEVIFEALPDIKIVNHYGPTETTIGTLAHPFQFSEFKSFAKNSTIGKPIYNAKAYILNDSLNRVPIGEPGELYISGKGVALGYLNREALTRERFITSPFIGERLYKTGDVVRLWPDQSISYLGRVDHQVKIRGNRVELEEVEAILGQYEKVNSSIVKYEQKNNSEDHIMVGYIVAREKFEEADLRHHARQYLPIYMIPELIIMLDVFPLNANGKVDRNSLCHLQYEISTEEKEYQLPVTDTERKLVQLWKDILALDRVGTTDSFFDVGGHSLLATKLIGRIHKELDVKVSLKDIFDRLTIKRIADRIDTLAINRSFEIKPVKQQLYYNVSSAQRQIWTLNQLADYQTVFSMPKAYMLEGKLNISAFEKTINVLFQRHETLRTTFLEVDHEPKQVVHDINYFSSVLQYHDLSGSDNAREKIITMMREEGETPFDLQTGPLFRAKIIKVRDDLNVFLYNMHHIISDAWSKEIIWKEVILLYDAFRQDKENPLMPLKIHYKDYVAWLNQSLNGQDRDQHRLYWLNLFEEIPEALQLPIDYPRPKIKTTQGDAIGFSLPASLSNKVLNFTKKFQVSLFTVLMTGLKVLLYRYTNHNDIVVGTPVSGRIHEQLHDQIGLYLNNLAIRSRIDKNGTFIDALELCKGNILTAFEHQSYPFDTLLQEINYVRDFSRSPLYDVVVVLGSNDFSGEVKSTSAMQDVNLKSIQTGFRKSIVDLRFVFLESDKGVITFMLEYNKDLFKEETITQMGNQLIQLFDAATHKPEIRLNEIPFGAYENENLERISATEKVEEMFNFSF